ncbi:MAG: phosphonate ABC transporter, permease protein PhnE [Deltaproteobacteria bacterium]
MPDERRSTPQAGGGEPGFARFALATLCALALVTLWPALSLAQSSPPVLETVPDEVILGFNPAENAQGLQTSANDLARLVADRIHMPVRAYVSLDYTALVESMRSGQVHFGWLTPAPLVLAEQLFHVQILLTQVRRGSPTYYGAIIVRENSPFRRIEDLRGHTIAWVDPQSTSGYVIPRYLLIERGIDPQHFFRQQIFAGGHDAAAIAVQSGQVDAAAVWADPPAEGTGAWTRFLRNRPGPTVRTILYTPPVPSDAVGVNPEFARSHPMLVRNVRAALISIGQSEEGRAVLRHLNSTDGFVDANPAQYELVRRAFAATRASTRGRFEQPVTVVIFFVLCALAALLALPLWRRAPRVRAWAGWALFSTALVWSLVAAKLSFGKLIAGRGAMGAFLHGMYPLDRGVVPAVIESSIVTVQLALVGTVIAVPLALLFGFLAAENVTPSRAVRVLVRFVMNFNRSIDTLILALILVSAVGLGPLPGVIALAVHSVGALGKLFYEAIETLEPGPVEAMRSVGASPLQVLRWGIWPQFAPHFISIVLFRFELNVRVSTVLGLVGAGGIGFLLITYMRGAEYAKVTSVIAAIVVLVMALDAISTRLRRDVR